MGMSLFEFLSVMVSIVLGFSLASMLTGVSRLVRYPDGVRFYLPFGIWLLNLLLHFLLWWSFWDIRDVEWNYARFLLTILQPLSIFLVTTILIPVETGSGKACLRDRFQQGRRWFFAVFLFAEMLFIIDGPLVFNSEPAWMIYRLPQLMIIVAFVVGLVVRHDWAQHVAAWTVLAIMLWSSIRSSSQRRYSATNTSRRNC